MSIEHRQVGQTGRGSVTVVVPTYNSESVLGGCLASLQRQDMPPDEVIVSDGGSTDGTAEVARRFGALVVQMGANRSAQRNAGAKKASGEFVLFIDSDMRLTPRVISDCMDIFNNSDAALVIPEVFIGDGFWAKVRGFERSFYDGIWYIEAARWYRRSQFLKIGGFDSGLIGPEDWDLDQRIRQFGRVRHITAHIEHDEGRINLRRLLEKKGHYAGSLADFSDRHPERAALSLSALRRLRLLGRRPARLLGHPLLAAGVATVGIGEVAVMRGWMTSWNADSPEHVCSPQ